MRAVLQVLIDQVSLQQTTSEQIIARVASLEDTTKKQHALLNNIRSKIFKPAPQKNTAQAQNEVDNVNNSSKEKYAAATRRKDQNKKTQKKLGVAQSSPIAAKPEPVDQPPTASPEVIPLNALSSSEIDHTKLASVDAVLCKYQKEILQGKVTFLARKLATEAVIGKDILKRCTPRGYSYYPALPVGSLYTIKQTLLNTFPKFWEKPEEFAKEWAKCIEAIKAICSAYRRDDHSKKKSHQTRRKCAYTSNERPFPAVGPTVSINDTILSPLPSTEINKSNLVSVEKFMSLHSTAIKEGTLAMGQLARKLALEVFFGEEVLVLCTPQGRRAGLYGLPLVEFAKMKQLLMDCFPSYWGKVEEFEKKWSYICRDPISKLCSRLRKKKA